MTGVDQNVGSFAGIWAMNQESWTTPMMVLDEKLRDHHSYSVSNRAEQNRTEFRIHHLGIVDICTISWKLIWYLLWYFSPQAAASQEKSVLALLNIFEMYIYIYIYLPYRLKKDVLHRMIGPTQKFSKDFGVAVEYFLLLECELELSWIWL